MTTPGGAALRVGNRYRLQEQIGVGAMGVVWRATDELLNRPVAVKELLAVTPGTNAEEIEESRQRILREGRIGARLQHAHVISMFDVVVHEDRPWLVMEYLPSDSLATVVRAKGPLLPVQVAAIGRDVADGLAAAHAAGVVHRDVKPGNVLIGTDGRVKLTDFGVSRAVDDVQLTRTGLIAGTPAFLAPEIAQGRTPTAASDVFALGATLYAAVEGAPPFGLDDNAYALLHKVATEAPHPPEHAGPLTPVLLRLLAVDPAARPSASQARDLLAAVAAGDTVPDAPPPTGTAVLGVVPPAGPSTRPDLVLPAEPPPPPRRRAPVLVGAVVALLAIGGGATALALNGGGAAPAATPPAASAAPTTAVAPTSAAPTSAVATPTTAPTTSQAAAATDPVAFVQRYYALLPGDPDGAFALLGPPAQAQSGGRDQFRRFYATVAQVSVEGARRTGDNTVSANVRFVLNDGRITSEPYRFVITTAADGSQLMDQFDRA
jgi:eukaryotic-like serine/threonine-protein kinase